MKTKADADAKFEACARRIGELDAMKSVGKILDSLPTEVRCRIAAWIFQKYGREVGQSLPWIIPFIQQREALPIPSVTILYGCPM